MRVVREIVNNTIENEEGGLLSEFWTCMRNHHGDFGDAAKELLMALVCSENKEFQFNFHVEYGTVR